MRKLRLNADDLRVESFGTGAAAAGGTVVAHNRPPITLPTDETTHDQSRIDSCYFDTCYHTCDWTD